MKTIIGIDPGLTGGLAALGDEFQQIDIMPAVSAGTKNQIDEQGVVKWLLNFPPQTARVYLELVHAMPGQGVTSMFTFGCGWGVIRGILAGMGYSYELIAPQSWKKVVMHGQTRGSEYQVASRIFPAADWLKTPRCTTPHMGKVEAALIAEYGRRACR